MKIIGVCLLTILLVSCFVTDPVKSSIKVNMKNSTDLYNTFNGDFLAMMAETQSQGKSVVVAHRGGIAPGIAENSKLAFERVIRHLPAVVEIDIASTRDGVDILHHDRTLERTTTGVGLPSEMMWFDVAKLKLKDQSNRILAERVMTLDEFLQAYAQQTFLMIDMKSPSSDEAVVNQISSYGMIKSSVFIAYDLEQAKRIRQTNSHAILALGARTTDDITAIRQQGLANPPFISLTGNIQQTSGRVEIDRAPDHFVLAGSYLGEMPLDAAIEMTGNAPVDKEDWKGEEMRLRQRVNLIVSNQPFAMYRFLCSNQLGLFCP